MNGPAVIGMLAAIGILAVIYIVSDSDSAWPRISFVVAGLVGILALDLPWPATISILVSLAVAWAAKRAFDRSVDTFPWEEVLADQARRGLGEDWQERYGGDASGSNWGGRQQTRSGNGNGSDEDADAHAEGDRQAAGSIDRERALRLLGLAGVVTDNQVKRAYHRLMKKHHPDRGGSTEMAMQLNQARDLLLRH